MSQRLARVVAAAKAVATIRITLLAALAACVIPALLAAQAWGTTRSPVLEIEKMTFVASRGSVSEVVLRADSASFDTEMDVAHLRVVRVSVSSGKSGQDLEITCLRGELDMKTSNFRAEGDVKGRTAGGLEFAADWIRYDHEEGVLFTDAPVLITESGGTFRGGGFRYVVEERRFKLLGGASVVQEN